MMAVDWAGYGYAALVASGGVIGYVKAGKPNKKAQEVTMYIGFTLEPKLVCWSLVCQAGILVLEGF